MTPFGIIIPARFASTRLPGKPLRLIAGKPLILWAYENAKRAGADFVWVATDDQRIEKTVRDFGGEVVMTSASHLSGTDRLAEVAEKKKVPDETILVNVQGDEPLLAASSIQNVALALSENRECGISTAAHPLTSAKELFDPNIVKVVVNRSGSASYFSRAPIPWVRDAFSSGSPQTLPEGVPFLRHIGLYAYRAKSLRQLSALPPASVELAESLEQLRALDAGIAIHVSVLDEAPTPGVDTEEDLKKAEELLSERSRLRNATTSVQ